LEEAVLAVLLLVVAVVKMVLREVAVEVLVHTESLVSQ
jgi:hypothetical protein